MQFILTCPNGKQIDMSGYILAQMQGELTRDEVQERIDYYKLTNSDFDIHPLNIETL
jgi:hypothetical protein